ncbi:hypothetical protein ACWC5I_41160, partial [Kitasatospora sp. NPDC001574]
AEDRGEPAARLHQRAEHGRTHRGDDAVAERYPAAEQAALERRTEAAAGHGDTRRRVYGPGIVIEPYDTETQPLRAEAVLAASPIRKERAAAA